MDSETFAMAPAAVLVILVVAGLALRRARHRARHGAEDGEWSWLHASSVDGDCDGGDGGGCGGDGGGGD